MNKKKQIFIIILMAILAIGIIYMDSLKANYIKDKAYIYETISKDDIEFNSKLVKNFEIVNPVVENVGINTIDVIYNGIFVTNIEVNTIGIKDFDIRMIDKVYNIGDKFDRNDIMVSITYEDDTSITYCPDDIEVLLCDSIIRKYNVVLCRYHDAVAITVFEGE